MRRMERGSLGGVGESLQARASGKEAEAGAAGPRRASGHPRSVQHGKLRVVAGGVGEVAPVLRDPFPSARQKRCAGLKRSYYPDYVREFVDYDYDDSLPEDARVFLAAFSEEYYRGWRLKKETQLHGLTHLRAAGAEQQRRRAHQDPLGFAAHRGTELVERPADRDVEAEMVRALDEDSEKLSELIEHARNSRRTPTAQVNLARLRKALRR
jgi:hypothetical protein